MSDDLIFRLRTQSGHSRLVCPGSATYSQLQSLIEQKTSIPPAQQQLSFNPPPQLNARGTLQSLKNWGFQSGTLIYLENKGVATLDDVVPIHCQKKMSCKDLPSQTPSTTTGNYIPSNDKNNSSSSGFHKSDTSEPTFKSFDAFLKERSFDTSDLPGVISYRPQLLEKGKMTKVPPSVTLKHQAYRHVDHLELMNVEEIKQFVDYWRNDLHMSVQRMGWMFGYYREDTHYPLGIRAVCEAIYEPPQRCIDDVPIPLTDTDFSNVVAVAKMFGLEPIGWIFTHFPRESLLSAEEIIRIARTQLDFSTNLHYTGYPCSHFVTCTITLVSNSGGEVVPSAFMVSDLGMALVRDDLIDCEASKNSTIKLRAALQGELLPQILESGKEANAFDSDWFLVRINESAPLKVRSIFKYTLYPRENRIHPIETSSFQTYFNRVLKPKTKDSHAERFSDFHLLLAIAKIFDIDTVEAIVDAIVNHKPFSSDLEDVLVTL